MAKLPEIKRISREDLPESPDWVNNLLSPVNSFMDTVYRSLNKSLTFQDNIQGAIRDLEFRTSATYTSGDFTPVAFSYGSGSVRPAGVLLLQIRAGSGQVIKQAVTLQWSENNGTVSIDYVSGLADSSQYFIRVVII